jgi:hypothetical protein
VCVPLLITISRTLQQHLILMILSMPYSGFTQGGQKASTHSCLVMVLHFLYQLMQISQSLSGCNSAMEFSPNCMRRDILLPSHPNLTTVHALGAMKAGQSCSPATILPVVSCSSAHNCHRGTLTFQS